MNKIINIKSKVEFFFEVLDSTLLLCIANRNSISQQTLPVWCNGQAKFDWQ